MSKNLKDRTISGLVWNFVDSFASQGMAFVVGIVLARLLEPRDFGLIGMMTIFISISQWFVSSGFGQALIRKKDCTQADYSTVFICNMIMGVALYLVLLICAPLVASFFNEPRLTILIRVFAISILIIAVTVVQRAQITKRLDFRLQTKISIISSITAGTIAIFMAYWGWGVWSLVYKTIIENGLNSLLLWLYNKWKPSYIFSKQSFKDLFGFGYKLMLRGLIYTIFNNIYYALIGKYFSTAQLGFYTKAEQFANLPSTRINKIINQVSYPALSELQENPVALKKAYKKIFVTLVYITSVFMITLAAFAEPIVITLIGEKWRESIPLLQLLSIIGLLYPLCDYNLTILKIVNMPTIILKLEIINRIISIPIIILGIYLGIKELLLGLIALSLISFIINCYYSGRYISYNVFEQLRDIFPNILISIVIGMIGLYYVQYLPINGIFYLLLGLLAMFVITIVLSEIFRIRGYLNIKNIILERFFKKQKK